MLGVLLLALQRIRRVLGTDGAGRLVRYAFNLLLSLQRRYLLQALVVIVCVVDRASNLIYTFQFSAGRYLLQVVASKVSYRYILKGLVDEAARVDVEAWSSQGLRLRGHALNIHLGLFSVAQQRSSIIIFVQIA